jgi:hypothetical protein
LIEVDAKNKKYCRFSVQDCGIVMEDKNKNISIKWDNPYYPIERFVFDVQGNKYIQK